MKVATLLTVLLSISITLRAQAPPHKVGWHTWKVSTRSAEAQRFFDEGLMYLYAYNHDEAMRLFTKATIADPNCALAWWGVAMASGPNFDNTAVDSDMERRAVEALAKARNLKRNATPLENSLIAAASKRFAYPQPEDRIELNRAYAHAMRNVWSTYRHADVGALFAESMMILRPWDLWTSDGKPQPGTIEIVKTLREVIAINGHHPFALRLYIHVLEASQNFEQAIEAADRLRSVTFGLGRIDNAPSHIDMRVGAWHKAIAANQRAIVADDMHKHLLSPRSFHNVYIARHRHMLAFAAMMTGQTKLAIHTVDEMVASIPSEFIESAAPVVDGFMAMPIMMRLKFGLWDEVLAAPEYADVFPIAKAIRRAARSVAYLAKGMPKEARAEQWHFYEAMKLVPNGAFFGNNSASDILPVAKNLMNGGILVAEGNINGAIGHLKKGVEAEDQLRYNAPPDWIQPLRHTLGALLLSAKRYAEAENVYRQDLKRLPNNGWSLAGLVNALEKQGKLSEARAARNEFIRVWSSADIAIDSSCLCIPKGS